MQQLQAQEEDCVCIAQYIEIFDRTNTDLPEFFLFRFGTFFLTDKDFGQNCTVQSQHGEHSCFFFKVWVMKSPMT